MKRVRLVIVLMIVSALMAASLSACGSGGQSTDIAGSYKGGEVTYVFAEDGTASVTENGETRYGYYTADGRSIEIRMDGETRKFDYTFEGDKMSLFSPGSIFGVTYDRTAEASASIEGWIQPKTVKEEPEEKAPGTTAEAETAAGSETTAAPETTAETAAPETTAETETAVPETSEETSAEPETTAADTFENMVKGDVTEGAIVTFGTYEQDNDESNGAEPIEWIVLKVDGSKALMISRYALDCQPFDTSGGSVTWDACSLNTWLNDTFINAAFDPDERNTIQPTYVPAEYNPDYPGVWPGYDVENKVFLLSTNQAYIYLSMNERKCIPTAYAIAQGAGFDEDLGGCWGWLRTPGNGNDRAACTDSEGKMYYAGVPAGDTATAVRPALCVRFR